MRKQVKTYSLTTERGIKTEVYKRKHKLKIRNFILPVVNKKTSSSLSFLRVFTLENI